MMKWARYERFVIGYGMTIVLSLERDNRSVAKLIKKNNEWELRFLDAPGRQENLSLPDVDEESAMVLAEDSIKKILYPHVVLYEELMNMEDDNEN